MRKTAAVLALLSASLWLAGCAGDDLVEGVSVQATEMKFTPSSATLMRGANTIVVKNVGDLRHTFSINSIGQEVTVNPGDTKTLKVDLEPGEYVYVCRVLDHEGLGMHGVLTVK